MAVTISFDTLAFSKKLEAAGVPSAQAEVHAEALSETVDEHIATKQDIAEIVARIKNSEATLRRDIKESELRLMIRLGALLSASIAVVATLVKLL